MENFPQSFEPVGSDSILEQFVQLKNKMQNILTNEIVKTSPQNLSEEQKNQARENIGAGSATLNVIDNLTSQSNIDALSANQGRVLNEKINSSVQTLNQTLNQTISQNVNELQQEIDANGGDIASLQGDVSELIQEISRTLKTPMSAPSETELVGINTNNAQVSISAGNGISIVNNVISADIKDWVNFTNAFDLSIGTSDVQNDISSLITDYDPNGEYETIVRIAGENDTSGNGSIAVKSDVVTLGLNSIFARGGDNKYKVNIFTIPFKRYIYCSKTNFASSSSVRIYGYRRIK